MLHYGVSSFIPRPGLWNVMPDTRLDLLNNIDNAHVEMAEQCYFITSMILVQWDTTMETPVCSPVMFESLCPMLSQ